MIAYRARLVRPVSAPDISDGVVVVDGDRVAWVGPAARAPAGEFRDLGDVVLGPGLVNAHTHLDLTATRGLLDGLGFREWIRTLTTMKREAGSADLFLDSARAGIREGLRHGVTTYADTSDNDAALRAMRELGVRGIAYREVFGPEPELALPRLEELQGHVADMRSLETPLVRVGVSPHAPYSVCDGLYKAVAAWARAERLPIAVHIAEGTAETRLVRDADGEWAEYLVQQRGIPVSPRGRSPVALLEACDLLGTQTLLIHCVHVDEGDIATIARHDCGVAHCPRSNAWFRHGASPIAALRAAGVRVGIGTDSVAVRDGMDVSIEAEASAQLHAPSGPVGALASGAPAAGTSLRSADLVRWCTLDSARALGLDLLVGSIEVGKQADLAAFPHPPRTPYAVSVIDRTHDATLVTVAGAELVRDGRIVRPDNGLAARMGAHHARLAEWRSRNTSG